jgi:zinc D-Ala-D-Ala dipeptidase
MHSSIEAINQAKQMLLTISSNWQDQHATMFLYDRANTGDNWHFETSFPVMLGRGGMAWGLGIFPRTASMTPEKREGDGCAPAGVFRIPMAFGYGPPTNANYPYLQLTATVFGVDDPHSIHYNQVVDTRQIPAPDWADAETMLRHDDLYQMGFIVDHNAVHGPQDPAYGSCIFLHIWRSPHSPTSGCTSMAKPSMISLAAWLKADDKPVLVQLPKNEYKAMQEQWALPDVSHSVASVGLSFIIGLVCLLKWI